MPFASRGSSTLVEPFGPAGRAAASRMEDLTRNCNDTRLSDQRRNVCQQHFVPIFVRDHESEIIAKLCNIAQLSDHFRSIG
jgi:hypothetical protein